ncbi:MAG: putative kinase [uncultured bacterium]|nr:MAG: putative kinase [uncultured bacterium]
MTRTQGIVITQTPFRIGFFGGGTDFPDFFNQSRGAVLGAAIDKYMYVTVNSLARFFEKRIRLSYAKLEYVNQPSQLENEIARRILETHPCLDENSFLDINTFADLPGASGVGSSSSFTVGMLNAIYALHGIYRLPELLAEEAIQIERGGELQKTGGWQDQVYAACGGFNKIIFSQNRFHIEPICLSYEKKRALESACMMFFIGGLRSSAEMQTQTFHENSKDHRNQRLEKLCEQVDDAFSILTNSHYTASEMIERFGKLLHYAWEVKRSIASHISNPHVDAVYAKALSAGAYGGKLCGAGGGGFLLLVAPPEKRPQITQALSEHKLLDIAFQEHGSRVIYSKSCHPQSVSAQLEPVLVT